MSDEEAVPAPDDADAPEVEEKPKRKKKEPAPPAIVPSGTGDHAFRQVGLGYQLAFPSIGTVLGVDHLKRSSEGLSGDLIVRTKMPGARIYERDEATGYGVLHMSRINLTSGTTRKTLGNLIAGRIEGGPESVFDWHGFIDELATRVMFAERQGDPVEKTNGVTRPDSAVLLLRPFLPKGMPSVWFADGMSSKSTLAVAVAVTMRTGHAVIPGLVPRITGQVLYLDWETDFGMIDVRQKQISTGAALPPTNFLYRRCRRPLVEMTEELARLVTAENVVLVIVDSMTLAMGSGRDNADPADTAIRFYGALSTLTNADGPVTSLCIDHVPKSGDGSKPYGSVYRSNFARATWHIRRSGDEEEGSVVHLVMSHEKHNTTRKFAPVGLEIAWDDDDETEIARSISIRQENIGFVPSTPGTSLGDRIVEYLKSVGHAMEPVEIAKANDWPGDQVRARLRDQSRFKRVAGGYWLA